MRASPASTSPVSAQTQSQQERTAAARRAEERAAEQERRRREAVSILLIWSDLALNKSKSNRSNRRNDWGLKIFKCEFGVGFFPVVKKCSTISMIISP